MSKSHRTTSSSGRPAQEGAPGSGIQKNAGEGELSELWARGNQAATEQIVAPRELPEVEPQEAIRTLASRAVTALQIAPRDSALTQRLVSIIEHSALPQERRALIALRLRTDQATADEVVVAVTSRLGTDSERLRADVIDALQQIVSSPVISQRGDPVTLLSEAVTANVPSLQAPGVHGLLQDLVMLVAIGWDEEEEDAAPGDYAAEESGW